MNILERLRKLDELSLEIWFQKQGASLFSLTNHGEGVPSIREDHNKAVREFNRLKFWFQRKRKEMA